MSNIQGLFGIATGADGGADQREQNTFQQQMNSMQQNMHYRIGSMNNYRDTIIKPIWGEPDLLTPDAMLEIKTAKQFKQFSTNLHNFLYTTSIKFIPRGGIVKLEFDPGFRNTISLLREKMDEKI